MITISRAPIVDINHNSSVDQIQYNIGKFEIKLYSIYFKFYLITHNLTAVQKKGALLKNLN